MLPVCDVIPTRKTPFITLGLIFLLAATFVHTAQLDPAELMDLAYRAGVVPADPTWSSAVTSTLVHAGWIHVAVNLLFLWLFGPNVEDTMGRGFFALFYIVGAALSAIGYRALNPSSMTPLVGAGAPVAAIMGAYLALYPRSQILAVVLLPFRLDILELPAVAFPMFWLLFQLVDGFAPLVTRPSDAASALASYGAAFVFGALAGIPYRGRRWDR